MERWKPEYDEEYWVIDTNCGYDSYTWINDAIDNEMFESGNCFRTEAEAKSAAEKVKELLLHLQPTCNKLATDLQDKQLPKLTAEVFDRPDCPAWAKYAVVNMLGTGFFYENEPSYGTENYKGLWYVDTGRTLVMQDIIFDSTDWQNSLVERPAKLPDWCKAGGYGYAYDSGYFKIIEIIDGGENLKVEWVKEGVQGTVFGCNIKHKKQARLRPYNADEMKALVGGIIETQKDIAMVLGYSGERNKICVATKDNYFSAETLLAVGATSDGNPCGVLEHLENGEWVQ